MPDKITFLPDNDEQNSIAIVSLPDKAQSESMYTLKFCESRATIDYKSKIITT